MTLKVICAWCGDYLGLKPANCDHLKYGAVSHSICCACQEKVLLEAAQLLNPPAGGDEKMLWKKAAVKSDKQPRQKAPLGRPLSP